MTVNFQPYGAQQLPMMQAPMQAQAPAAPQRTVYVTSLSQVPVGAIPVSQQALAQMAAQGAPVGSAQATMGATAVQDPANGGRTILKSILKGAGIGAAIGAAVGLVPVLPPSLLTGSLIGAGVGAAIGFVTGLLHAKRDKRDQELLQAQGVGVPLAMQAAPGVAAGAVGAVGPSGMGGAREVAPLPAPAKIHLNAQTKAKLAAKAASAKAAAGTSHAKAPSGSHTKAAAKAPAKAHT